MRKLRNRERVWRKYREQHHWTAYKTELRIYNNLLYKTKCEYISAQVHKFKGDRKNLYKLVSSLTGVKRENPVPDCKSDKDLAEHFAEFFTNKIEKIRDSLDLIDPLFDPLYQTIQQYLSTFHPIEESGIRKLLSKLKTKSCELDLLPTYFIKENVNSFAQILKCLVNASFEESYFSIKWKTAILRPL